MTDWTSLSIPEQARAAAWIGELHLHTVSTFLASQQGLMDQGFADAWIDWYVSHLKTPGLNQWWRTSRVTHHQGFVRHNDERLGADDGPAPIHTVLPRYELSTSG